MATLIKRNSNLSPENERAFDFWKVQFMFYDPKKSLKIQNYSKRRRPNAIDNVLLTERNLAEHDALWQPRTLIQSSSTARTPATNQFPLRNFKLPATVYNSTRSRTTLSSLPFQKENVILQSPINPANSNMEDNNPLSSSSISEEKTQWKTIIYAHPLHISPTPQKIIYVPFSQHRECGGR